MAIVTLIWLYQGDIDKTLRTNVGDDDNDDANDLDHNSKR